MVQTTCRNIGLTNSPDANLKQSVVSVYPELSTATYDPEVGDKVFLIAMTYDSFPTYLRSHTPAEESFEDTEYFWGPDPVEILNWPASVDRSDCNYNDIDHYAEWERLSS